MTLGSARTIWFNIDSAVPTSGGGCGETLVVMCSELGRTWRISPISAGGKSRLGEVFTPARHHWGDVFPCFVTGGGGRGQVIGWTDRFGGSPVTDAYTPSDLAATISYLMGTDPASRSATLLVNPIGSTSKTRSCRGLDSTWVHEKGARRA